jgi:hypothetical protein
MFGSLTVDVGKVNSIEQEFDGWLSKYDQLLEILTFSVRNPNTSLDIAVRA